MHTTKKANSSADADQFIEQDKKLLGLSKSRVFYLFLIITALISLFFISFLDFEKHTFTQDIQDELSTIADLKSNQIVSWYEDRVSDVKLIQQNKYIQDMAIRYLDNPQDLKSRAELLEWMMLQQKLSYYAVIILFDNQGKARLSYPALQKPLEFSHNQYIQACLDSSKVIYADLHRDIDIKGNPSPKIHESYWIPVTDLDQKSAKIKGLWSVRLDPNQFLFPIIQTWPIKKKTAETFLVRREGNYVVYLNELRFMKDTATKLKFEISKNPQLTSVMAVSGQTGIVEGLNYRNHNVISAIRKIQGTPWFMIASIDKQEIYQPFKRKIIVQGIVLFLLLLSIALTIRVMERKKDNLWLKNKLYLEQERAKMLEESVFLSNLLNESTQPFVTGGLDGSILKCNQAYLDLIGYTQEELSSINYVTTLTPVEWRDFEKGKVQEVLKTGNSARYEKEYIRKDGTRIQVEIIMNARTNENGDVQFYYGYVTDITERNRAAQSLKMNERKFRNVFENSLIGISITSPEGIIDANHAFCSMLGYSHEELQKNYIDITYPEDIPVIQETVSTMLSGMINHATFSKRYIHKNGSIVWADVSTFLQRSEDNTPEFFITIILDVTQQRLTVQALRESEARFKGTFHQSPYGLALVGFDKRFIKVNEVLCNLLGYSETELTAMAFPEITHPDNRVKDLKNIEKLMKGEIEKYATDKRYIRKDGSFVWAHVTVSLVKDNEGKPLYLLPCVIDITERMAAIKALQESEHRFREIFEHMSSGVTIYESIDGGKDFVIKEMNSSGEMITKTKRNDITGKSVLEVFPGIVSMGLFDVMIRVNETGKPEEFPTSYYHDSKLSSWYENYIMKLENDDIVAIYDDVSLRMIAENEVLENEQRLQSIIDNAPFGAHTYELMNNNRLVLIGANLSSDTILHIDTKTLIGMDHLEAFPGNKDTGLDNVYRKIAIGGGAYSTEQVAYQDGMISGAFEIHVLNIGRNRMTVFFRDVTEKKKADDAIMKLNDELEGRVFERTSQLELANKELEAFSYSVSHDLCAPLRIIDGWSLALKEDCEASLDEQGSQYLNRIRTETKRMGELIDALLKLSHISRTKVSFNQINLSNLAEQVMARLHEEDPTRLINFTVQPDMTVMGETSLLEVVLSNLIGNAWKFSKPRLETRIEFGSKTSNGANIYFIQDNGVGFDMKYAEKLFGAFQRMHLASEFPGTGIGLATVQRIIHLHGGEIWAEAEVDKGATFYFTLKDHI